MRFGRIQSRVNSDLPTMRATMIIELRQLRKKFPQFSVADPLAAPERKHAFALGDRCSVEDFEKARQLVLEKPSWWAWKAAEKVFDAHAKDQPFPDPEYINPSEERLALAA